MSVMAETSQSAIGPYVAVATVGLALNAWTAVFREVVSTKGGGGEEGGGEGEDGAVARNTGSHCGGHDTPQAERSAFELGWPM